MIVVQKRRNTKMNGNMLLFFDRMVKIEFFATTNIKSETNQNCMLKIRFELSLIQLTSERISFGSVGWRGICNKRLRVHFRILRNFLASKNVIFRYLLQYFSWNNLFKKQTSSRLVCDNGVYLGKIKFNGPQLRIV